MCGICGWVDFDHDPNERGDRDEIVAAMTATLADRGPDAGGTFTDRHVALGHRRLAVIDVPGGVQPMIARTPAGPVALVYSGEVYNHVELRDELMARGHRFTTRSDTEVVLRGYQEWGDRVAERLNGMYAFAVWDGPAQRLVLVRDRVGIKPLYLRRTPGGVLFGSEPKAVLAHPEVPRVVDVDCLHELIGFTKTPGWALWKDVREVLPATTVTIDRAGMRERTYWSLPAAEHPDDLETTTDRIGGLLDDIVRRQVVSDVELCCLLSGGLDSSAVTALAAAHDRRGGSELRTFTVDFIGLEESFRPDEMRQTPDAPFVREVVAGVGSRHRDVVLDPAELVDPDLRRAVVACRDMPIGLGDIDSSMYLLFRRIRQEATVTLSGEFADELFGGYLWFHVPEARDAPTFPWLAFQNAITTDRTALLHPGLRERLDIPGYIADQYGTAVAGVEQLPGSDPFERHMRTICHLHLTRLVRALLDRKDRLSMAVGLEVRVPFADHRLVEYVYNVPWAMKNFDGREKSLLRAAVRSLLPASVTDRVKSPYPTPPDPKVAQALQGQAADVLAEHGNAVFDIVDRAWLDKVVRLDPAEVDPAQRVGIERVLDLYHWIDIYRPELRLG
ncbi:asparagine synthase (glutamine-hydrolyzing) [Spirillospora sp. NPDC052242]